MGTLFAVVVFVGFAWGIWFSYRLFMRGSTDEEKVAALLPAGFKPDLSYRKGDTYLGYEKANNRLVLVDCPHVKVLAPAEVQSLEPEELTMVGVTHHYLVVKVEDPRFSRYKIWFQFRRARRDQWAGQLAEICKA